jgi:hypothetical protein
MKASDIKTLDKSIQRRVRLEEKVVKAIYNAVAEKAHRIRLCDGEEWANDNVQSWAELKNDMHQCDEEWLQIVFKPGTFTDEVMSGIKHRCTLWLVYGNDGYDVVCDCAYNSQQVHDFISPIMDAAADKAERGVA